MICPRCSGSGFVDWSLEDDIATCDYPGCVDGRVYDGPSVGEQSEFTATELSIEMRSLGIALSKYE